MLRSASRRRTLHVYAAAVRLLPAEFRARYGEPMLQSVADALDDPQTEPAGFLLRLVPDLARTILREHFFASSRCLMQRPVAVYTGALIVLLGAFSLISALVSQQLLRRSANQPQQQMAERYAAEIAAGADPAEVLPAGRVDPSRDLDPFIVFYDRNFTPLRSSAVLGGSVPIPPRGVFEYAAQHGSNILSWQPRRDARIAMVLLRIDGAHPGFLLIGRSLSNTELAEGLLYHAAVASLAAILLLVAAASFLLARAFRRVRHDALAATPHAL